MDAIRYSIIVCAYNTVQVARQAIESILPAVKADNAELVIVDNHGPDELCRQYIRRVKAEGQGKVKLVDPGKNLGCHGGWNCGFKHSEGQYVLKYDDDTVMQTANWLEKMSRALEDVPELGFISADIDAKQNNQYELRTTNRHLLEVPKTGVVGFSCVMFRRSDIMRWGQMRTGAYKTATPRVIVEERLYGGEEVYYAQKVLEENRFFAHYPAVFVHHLGNEERNPDYVFWKRAYGYYGWTDKSLEEWTKSGLHLKHYYQAIAQELNASVPNDVLLVDWCTRVSQIGDHNATYVLNEVLHKSQNAVVQETCREGLKRIEEKKGV